MGLVTEYYTWFYDLLGRDDYTMVGAGTAVFVMGTMWFINFFLLSVDLTGKPEWIVKYKVQPGNTGPVDAKKVWDTAKTVLFNQLVLGIPVGYGIYKLAPVGFCDPKNIPPAWIVLRDTIVGFCCYEVSFYYTHRLIHYGPLYKAIHKKHHEWQAPIGISALYAHPVEFLLGNVIPVLIGPMVMRSHMLTIWIYGAVQAVETVIAHSGYHLPFSPKSPQFHDFHHLKFTGNYGVFGVMDWLHGTDAVYRDSVQFQRDGFLTSLTPVHVTYPQERLTKTKSG